MRLAPALALAALVLSPLTLTACSSGSDQPAPGSLEHTFAEAAADYDVPRDLLVAISYTLTRLEDRSGMEAIDSGVGLMNLHADGSDPSLSRAAQLVGRDTDDVTLDTSANVRAGAALLRSWANQRGEAYGLEIEDLQQWYPVVARFSGADDPLVAMGFAEQVYDVMQWGLLVETDDGELVEIAPHALDWRDLDREATTGSSLIDQYIPASSANYTNDSRTSVSMVVIHTMEGSYSGSISWFQSSEASASAHYMIRSSDGEITQMVDEEDIAWHAGDWETNKNSIGIEHEGFVSDPDTWYTDAMYRSSAALTRDICDRYGIPKDRDHIIGHYEVPGCSNPNAGGTSCHTDPGDGWDWDYYMSLVNETGTGAGSGSSTLPDGTKHGSFEVWAHSSRYGKQDTCSGTLEGTASNGNLYLTGTCRGDHYPDAGELRIVWSGSTMGTSISGTVVVDGYSDPWAGNVQADGSVTADMAGTKDVGGDVGVVTYDASIHVDP